MSPDSHRCHKCYQRPNAEMYRMQVLPSTAWLSSYIFVGDHDLPVAKEQNSGMSNVSGQHQDGETMSIISPRSGEVSGQHQNNVQHQSS